MKSLYKPKKRLRKSKFDPYIKEIAALLDTGLSVARVAEEIEYHFDDIVDSNALYTFIRSRDLRSKVTMGGTNLNYDAPCCEGCDDCLTVTNTNESEVLLCLPSKRIVNKSCKTSPIWCNKRKKAERVS